MKESIGPDDNSLVKMCRQIVVNEQIDRMQDILDCAAKYTLMAREEMNDGMLGAPNMFIIADYHMKCLIEINRCADRLQQKIDGIVPSSNFTWHAPK